MSARGLAVALSIALALLFIALGVYGVPSVILNFVAPPVWGD